MTTTTTDTELLAGTSLVDEVLCEAFYGTDQCGRPAVYRAIFDCTECDRGSTPLCAACRDYFLLHEACHGGMVHHRRDRGWAMIRAIHRL